jgi:hypothetical protein
MDLETYEKLSTNYDQSFFPLTREFSLRKMCHLTCSVWLHHRGKSAGSLDIGGRSADGFVQQRKFVSAAADPAVPIGRIADVPCFQNLPSVDIDSDRASQILSPTFTQPPLTLKSLCLENSG